MGDILVQMECVLNIINTGKALLEAFRTYFGKLAGENDPILQKAIEVPNLIAEQCKEAMAGFLEDIWNLPWWGCYDPGHSFFKCPYLTTVQRIFFDYRYLHHHTETKPLVAKCYMEKAAHLAGTGTSPV